MLYVSSLVVVFPLGNIIMPLVLWMLKSKDSDLIEFHGKNALNFQLTILVMVIISIITWSIFIGAILFFVMIIFDVIVMLQGAYGAYTGEQETIKYCYKFIK